MGRKTPLTPPPLASTLLQLSPFGAIPKKHRPGKWRLIVDLSSPAGCRRDLCSVSYASLDEAIGMAGSLGKGALMAKLDLKEAYRAVTPPINAY